MTNYNQICPFCHTRNLNVAVFCHHCGKRLKPGGGTVPLPRIESCLVSPEVYVVGSRITISVKTVNADFVYIDGVRIVSDNIAIIADRTRTITVRAENEFAFVESDVHITPLPAENVDLSSCPDDVA